MEAVLRLVVVLLFVVTSRSAPYNICRVTGFIRVSCPVDYHCCGDDECCKLTFRDDDEELTSEEVNEHHDEFYKLEPLLILVRIIIITVLVSFGYFILRYFNCKAFRPDIRRLTVPSLPRYKHLEKESTTCLTVAAPPYNVVSVATGVAGHANT